MLSIPPAITISASPKSNALSSLCNGFHTTGAYLVTVVQFTSSGKPGKFSRLACGRLSEVGLDHATHQYILNLAGLQSCFFQRRFNGNGA